jgi:hypothetical protein
MCPPSYQRVNRSKPLAQEAFQFYLLMCAVPVRNEYPFCEVIDSNQDKAVTIGSLRIDVPYDVHTPHGEWLWSCHVVERNGRCFALICIQLALLTLHTSHNHAPL